VSRGMESTTCLLFPQKNCDNRNMNDYIRRVTEELCQLGITENDTKSLFVQGL